MARGRGRPRAPEVVKFRQWCRDLVGDPEIQAVIIQRAKTDADFALRVAEHGFGRPPQSLAVHGTLDHQHTLERRIYLADGTPLLAADEAVSDPGAN